MSYKISEENYLKHFGVLGMKWGIRRYQPYPKGEGSKGTFKGKKGKENTSKMVKKGKIQESKSTTTKTKRVKKKEAKQLVKDQKKYDEDVRKNWHKAHNKAAEYANEVLVPQVNKKYGKYDWSQLDVTYIDDPKGDPKLVAAYKNYVKEHQQVFDKALAVEYDKMFGKRPGS